jgi:hypothetical protein
LTGKTFPGLYNPYNLRHIDPDTNKEYVSGYCMATGRPYDPQTGELMKLDKEGRPVAKDGTVYPGVYDKVTGKYKDLLTQKPVTHINFDENTGIPLNPDTREPYPIDFKTMKPYHPLTKEKFCGFFDHKTNKMIDYLTKLPYDLGKFDPETGIPLDKNGKKMTLSGEGTVKDFKGKELNIKYDLLSKMPINPQTKLTYVPKNYDPDNGRPINYGTGKLYPIDPETFQPYDPATSEYLPGYFDPKSGYPIDPKTKTIFRKHNFDTETGIPLDNDGSLCKIDAKTLRPIKKDGTIQPGSFDPASLIAINPHTKEYFCSVFDEASGRPINSKTGDPYPIDNKTKMPYDPQTGKFFPGKFDEYSVKPIDPISGKAVAWGYDEETGRPLDNEGTPYPIDIKTFRPYDPKTNMMLPGFFDPKTGEPVDPFTKKIMSKPFKKGEQKFIPINLRNNYPGKRFR